MSGLHQQAILSVAQNNSTFSVIAEAHLGLAKANRVLALTDAIELFEVRLGNTL